MGLFQKFKEGLRRTQEKVSREIKRIFTGSPKLTLESIEELEEALLGGDFGMALTTQIIAAVRREYEGQGRNGQSVLEIAQRELVSCFPAEGGQGLREFSSNGPVVVSMVGVNGVGKTTTAAKLAWKMSLEGHSTMLAACDTFRAAAIEQLKLWGNRLNVPVIAGNYGADPAAVAHDAIGSAIANDIHYLFIDTAGRLHTKSNLMQELQKVHRVMDRKLEGAPHETLLVLDASTGMNALTQAREFHKAVPLTGLVVTKLDGTSRGGMVTAIQKELGLPVKFIGLGEQPDDLQPFDVQQYAEAIFGA
ncbi:MAG: signal recognition particle-docking protein FtsY [Limisphaerales bacterium]|jgi:fused signal recognition particle receptor|nr:signal recognition particle-docking protein FtsY [Verrucomicrobiota bacterium]